ncbi:hypothetical protein Tco_0558658 [Tanacetum coccineum]
MHYRGLEPRVQSRITYRTHSISNTCEHIIVLKLLSRVLRKYHCDIARSLQCDNSLLFTMSKWNSFQCHHQTALRSNGGNGNLNPIQMLKLRRLTSMKAQDLIAKTSAQL